MWHSGISTRLMSVVVLTLAMLVPGRPDVAAAQPVSEQDGLRAGIADNQTVFVAEVYAVLAGFDVDRDGVLEDVELDAFEAQLAAGALVLPWGRTQHQQSGPPTWVVRVHATRVYAWAARCDPNHDGQLDLGERRACAAGPPWLWVGPPWRR